MGYVGEKDHAIRGQGEANCSHSFTSKKQVPFKKEQMGSFFKSKSILGYLKPENVNKIKYFSKLGILIHTAKMLVKHILCAVRLKYPRSISRFVEYATHSVKIVSHTKVQSLLDQVRPFNKICSYICLNKNIVNKFNSIFVFVIDNRN